MPSYHYVALTKNHRTRKGLITAESDKKARDLLRQQDLIPTQISVVVQKEKPSQHRIKKQALTLFTRQLATLLSAGIPLEEALSSLAEQTEKGRLKNLILRLCIKIREGYSLADAMLEYPSVFPDLYIASIKAGQQTGRLDHILEKLAHYTENQQTIYQKIQQSLLYPAVMLVVSTAIICFLLAFVVPKIIDVFTESGQTLPLMTIVLIKLSGFIQHFGLYTAAFIAGFLFIFQRSLKKPVIRELWHRFLLHLPLYGRLIQSTNVSRYIHTFSLLFSAGVPILDIMRTAPEVVHNRVIREAFIKATLKVRKGDAISVALKETGYISLMAIHLIANGEKSGEISAMMSHAAAILDNEVKQTIDTGLTLLEPFIILSMGAVVLFIVLSTLLPIFSMEQLVT